MRPDESFIIEPAAYCKMLLHVVKYPYTTVRGVLLGTKVQEEEEEDAGPSTSSSETNGGETNRDNVVSTTRIVDCIPAMHNSLVTPPLEVLFIHLDSYCQGNALSMVGVYFCNQRFGDTHFDDLWGKIALDKLGPSSVVIQVDNTRLSLNAHPSCLQPSTYESGKWRAGTASVELENEEDAASTTSLAIQSKWYRQLSDFENHLDQPCSADFYNTELTRKIKNSMMQL